MNYFDEETFKKLPESKSDNEFSDCKFVGVNFLESRFSNCLFLNCTFSNCNISNSRFTSCTLRDCKFKASKLIGINWSEENTLSDIMFDDCQLNYSVFLGMKLPRFSCINSQAKSCDFSESIIKKSSFSHTDLSDSSFHHADCEDALFNNAHNYFIDPSLTKLKNASFSFPEALSLLSVFEIKIDNLN